MNLWKILIILLIIIISTVGCSGVVNNRRINVSGFTKDTQLADFVHSFGNRIKKKGYSVKMISSEKHKNTISTSNGTFPILFEAEKESFSTTSIVRVCKDNFEGVFVQIVQAAILRRYPEKHFKDEFNSISNMLHSEYPTLKFEF